MIAVAQAILVGDGGRDEDMHVQQVCATYPGILDSFVYLFHLVSRLTSLHSMLLRVPTLGSLAVRRLARPFAQILTSSAKALDDAMAQLAVVEAWGEPCGQSKPQRISLSLTASYAPSWGLWEGIRELIQNWHDGLLAAMPEQSSAVSPGAPLEFVKSPSGDDAAERQVVKRGGLEVGSIEYSPQERRIALINHQVGLGREVLLLGYSKKAQHADVIGSFGEGLKVGAVALLRKGIRLRMLTRAESWSFDLLVDPAFGERVLTVGVTARPEVLDADAEGLPVCLQCLSASDTVTVVEGLEPREWALFARRFLFLRPPRDFVRTEVGKLLLDTQMSGDFFVKGVWINSDPDLVAGVDLSEIRLDRDRAAVLKKSDLQHQVSSMWVRAVHHQPELTARYYELLADERQSSDTAMADLYCDEDVAEAMAKVFRRRHGVAIPVSLKDSNSDKAQQLRGKLSCSTIVCSQALLAVLKKGGVRCDLDDLLHERSLQARRFVAMADLSEDEARCLASACRLVELADASASGLLLSVDIFESVADWTLESAVLRAEAFPTTGRLEVDRRALAPTMLVHKLFPASRCLAEARPGSACHCRESLVARALLGARDGGAAFAAERLLSAALAAPSAVLRCPDLGAEREGALRSQIEALEGLLREERGAHAEELRALKRRIADAEQELRRAEFKFVDASEAERAVREALEPELRRLRLEAAQLSDAQVALVEESDAAARLRGEVEQLRRRVQEAERLRSEAEGAAERRVAVAERSSMGLRRALAQRRELLQRMLREDPSAPLIAMTDPEDLRAAVEEIRLALREEASSSQCWVCVSDAANAVLLPCRHQLLCMSCARALTTCPVCRCSIDHRLQVYS